MDTILNYFDHIFLVLPQTAKVQKAKEELLGMAEDRYRDLKEQGKSENEAVGTVIEEFGNIDELAAELGVEGQTTNLEKQHFLSRTDVEDFLGTEDRADRQLAFGIFTLFISPVALIIMGMLNSGIRPKVSGAVIACVGLPVLLLCIAVGLCLVIFSSFSRKPWRFMEKEIFRMDYSTAGFALDSYQKQQSAFILHIMIGVALLIVGVIPVIMMGVFYENVPLLVRGIAVDAFMVLYGVSIFNFIRAGMSQKCFKVLRQTGRFSIKVKERRGNWKQKRQEKNHKVIDVVGESM